LSEGILKIRELSWICDLRMQFDRRSVLNQQVDLSLLNNFFSEIKTIGCEGSLAAAEKLPKDIAREDDDEPGEDDSFEFLCRGWKQ